MFRFLLWLKDRRNQAWFSPAVAALGAIVLALAARLVSPWLDAAFLPRVNRESVDGLLTIIATSMLSVATFSLGIMVSATASASSNATPRATELVMSDQGTRRAVGSFIAAFIYAIVAKIAMDLGYYGPGGLFVLFVATLGVLSYLVVSLVLWVRTLSTLGRLPDTLRKIEHAAWDALSTQARDPWMGARAGTRPRPDGRVVLSDKTGYLTHVDLDALQHLAQTIGVEFHLQVRPGAFVAPTSELLRITGAQGTPDALSDEELSELRAAFVTGRDRSYDQDPRFGLIVLGEVGQRALSSAVNDPGTAIQVLSILARLLIEAETQRSRPSPERKTRHDRLTVVALDEAAFIADSFDPIARDGAANLEVALRIQKLLHAVATDGLVSIRHAAREQARRALERSMKAAQIDDERLHLQQVHRELFVR